MKIKYPELISGSIIFDNTEAKHVRDFIENVYCVTRHHSKRDVKKYLDAFDKSSAEHEYKNDKLVLELTPTYKLLIPFREIAEYLCLQGINVSY